MAFIERRLSFHLDWLLLATVLVIVAMGITMIYSATQATTPRLYISQLYALALGLVAMLVALTIDYRTLADKSHWIYALHHPPAALRGSSASSAAARGGGFRSGSSTCSRRSSPSWPWRSCWRSSSARAGAAADRRRPADRRGAAGRPVPADRAAAGPRHGGHAHPGLPGRRATWPACRCAFWAFSRSPACSRRRRLEVRAEGLPEVAHPDVHRPVERHAGRRATSRSRPASPSGPAGCGARGS